jgi:hypothetical protein
MHQVGVSFGFVWMNGGNQSDNGCINESSEFIWSISPQIVEETGRLALIYC